MRKKDRPFLVLKALGPVNALIQRTARAKPFVVHIDKLSPYLSEPPRSWLEKTTEEGRGRSPVEAAGCEPVNEESDHNHETAATAERSLDQVSTNDRKDNDDTAVTDEDKMEAIAGYIDGQPGWSPRPKRAVRKPARYRE